MEATVLDSEVILHLKGGVEVDVLMSACDVALEEYKKEFRGERRAIKGLCKHVIDLSVGTSKSAAGQTEVLIAGDNAVLALRVMRQLAIGAYAMPDGIVPAVIQRALDLQLEVEEILTAVAEPPQTGS